MCGIAGANLSPEENIDARALIRALLLGIEERGRHATGVAHFEGHDAFVTKSPVPASRFVRESLYEIPRTTTNMMLHTRWASQGSPKNNDNNHPIDVGGIIGIHNGCCSNDTELFERIGTHHRAAEVDSEAIFATLLHGGEDAPQALSRVKGSAAVAWIDSLGGDPAVLHAARVSASPLIYGFSEAGSFLFASTHQALHRGVNAVGINLVGGPHTMREGKYLQVRQGHIIKQATFQTTARTLASMGATERRALNIA